MSTSTKVIRLDSEVLEHWASQAMAQQAASEAVRRYIA